MLSFIIFAVVAVCAAENNGGEQISNRDIFSLFEKMNRRFDRLAETVQTNKQEEQRSPNGHIFDLIEKVNKRVTELIGVMQNMKTGIDARIDADENTTAKQWKKMIDMIQRLSGRIDAVSKRIDHYHHHQVSTTRAPVTTTTGSTSTTPFTTTPVSWIFYPPGTHDHRVKRNIEGASFVGFGRFGSHDRDETTYVTSFVACVHYCVSVREHRSVQWNGVSYQWSGRYCHCDLNDVGHHNYNTLLHYKFH